jgi:hypothetical protein
MIEAEQYLSADRLMALATLDIFNATNSHAKNTGKTILNPRIA